MMINLYPFRNKLKPGKTEKIKLKVFKWDKISVLGRAIFLTTCLISLIYLLNPKYLDFAQSKNIKFNNITSNVTLTHPSPTPTPIPVSVSTQTFILPQANQTNNSGSWGVAKQVSEHSWTMKIGFDDRMATAQEIFDALNNYRQVHGSGYLAWDNNLANYAQSRADYFNQIGKTDEHAGFDDYLKNIDNVRQLNFYSLGENSSSGFRLLGTHIIEWMYAGDKPHNDNQLNPNWTHVGIGVKGTATDLIFGK